MQGGRLHAVGRLLIVCALVVLPLFHPSPGVAITTPTPSPAPVKPTPTPSPVLEPTPTPTPEPTLAPTESPATTPTESPAPTGSPTPTPALGESPAGVGEVSPSPTVSATSPAVCRNLVMNADFESGTGSRNVLDAATTQVPHWTRTKPSSPTYPRALNEYPYGPSPLGVRYAGWEAYGPLKAQGLAGELLTPTNVGASYVLSARVASRSNTLYPSQTPAAFATFTMRLRNSGSGSQSAAVQTTFASFPQTPSWKLVTGTVMSGAPFDRVVLTNAYAPFQNGAHVYVDEVRVCKVLTLPTWWKTPTVAGIAAGLLIVIGGLIIRWLRKRKHQHIGTVTLVK